MSQKEHLEALNPEQKKAVIYKDGPLLILAGAGAGKTKTITHRIIQLILSGVAPQEILAVTFTNKAAGEMRERVFELISKNTSLSFPNKDFALYEREDIPFVATFHALGAYIIRENATCLGLVKHFSILDRNESISLVKKALKQEGYDPKEYEPRKILGIISKQKGLGHSHREFSAQEHSYIEKVVALIWERYENTLRKTKSLDFDDLLLKTVALLIEHRDVLEQYRNRWKYIHIDEYQDTNKIQYKFAQLLAAKHKNLCVVGDIDQSIYSWRGADYSNILNFEEDYPNAKVITLEENYRSTKNIIGAAEGVIKKNKKRREKKLFTNNTQGAKITLHSAENEAREADFVALTSQKLINKGTSPNQIAVLYRANFQSRVLEEYFINYNIPYQILGTRFFERKEIKDMLAYLKASLNPDDLQSVDRVINLPPRGIGKVTKVKIFAGDKEKLSPNVLTKVNAFYDLLTNIRKESSKTKVSELLKYILKQSGLEDQLLAGTDDDIERLENIKELVTLATKYNVFKPEESLEKFLFDASLLSSDQDEIKKEGGVKLMTVHAAKGLEFSHVFIVGLEDDLFPHAKPTDESYDDEEERRLFYVALTRAKEKLHLSYAQERMIYGTRAVTLPSEFIFDIDESLFETEGNEEIINIE